MNILWRFAQRKQKRIRNPVEHPSWSFFVKHVKAVKYFHKKAQSQIFDKVLNTSLDNNRDTITMKDEGWTQFSGIANIPFLQVRIFGD